MSLNEKAVESSANPTFREALRFWLKLGFISFGGPAGQIAVMQHELVDNRRWVGQDAFLQALNFCMLLPGPEAQQLATYIGWKLHGLKGGLAAGILFVLPGALLLYGLAWLAAAHGESGPVAAVFAGLKPVVVALVLHALWRIGSKTIKTWLAGALAVGAFVAIEISGLPFPLVILLAGLVGWMSVRGRGAAVPVEAPVERFEVAAGWTYVLRMVLIYVVLLAVPLAAIVAFAGPDPFLTLGRFFTQAAFVTFGGADAVLPYVADAAVNQFQWLSPGDMMNGLALAESTPGPLILVLQYVGFFAGWNAPGNFTPLAAATLAAIITTYATFLPSIMLILTGAPFVERIARVKAAAGALSAITAAVVGVIATLTLFFAREVLLREGGVDFVAVAATLAAFLMLVRFKMGLHWVVLAGAVFGLVRASIF
jgi:chromate transporter